MWKRLVRSRLLAFVAAVLTILGFLIALVEAHRSTRALSGQVKHYGWIWLSGILFLLFVAQSVAERRRSNRRRRMRSALVDWCVREMERLLDSLPAGTYDGSNTSGVPLSLRAYYSGSLYIEPRFTTRRQRGDTESLFEIVESDIATRRRVVIRAEPGLGKSLFLQLLCLRLLDALAQSPSKARIPVLIPLDVVDSADLRGSNVRDTLLATYAEPQCDLPAALRTLIPVERFVILLDGLDELRSIGDSPNDTALLLGAVVTAADVVTSRESFFEIRISAGTVRNVRQVTLDPIPFDEYAEAYVVAYCETFGGDAKGIIETIMSEPRLRIEVERPLLLFMTTDILARPSGGVPPRPLAGWSATFIYASYIYNWLRREQLRADSVLSAEQKQLAAQYLAWELFSRSIPITQAYGSIEVTDLEIEDAMLRTVIARLVQERITDANAQAVEVDLRARNVLVRRAASRRRGALAATYGFAHKSFFEYLLATYVASQLRRDDAGREFLEMLLGAPFPDAVIRFLREHLREVVDVATRRIIERNLMALVNASSGGRRSTPHGVSSAAMSDSARLEMARQQAGNLVPIVASEACLKSLIARSRTEKSPFVRRGIAVGLAMHHDIAEPLDEFVALMTAPTDAGRAALSAHVGYNRIYYGDQGRTEAWADDQTPDCSAFFTKTAAQLGDPARYRPIWCMTIFTLSWLLTSGRELGEPEDVQTKVRRALARCEEITERSPALDLQVRSFAEVCHQNDITPESDC